MGSSGTRWNWPGGKWQESDTREHHKYIGYDALARKKKTLYERRFAIQYRSNGSGYAGLQQELTLNG